MGIAAHSATRHFELGHKVQKVQTSNGNISVAGRRPKECLRGQPAVCVTRPCQFSVCQPPLPPLPCSPACSLRTHSDLDWAFTKATRAALPATVPAYRYSSGSTTPFLRLQSLPQPDVSVVILSDLLEACDFVLHVVYRIVSPHDNCPLTSSSRSTSVIASLGFIGTSPLSFYPDTC